MFAGASTFNNGGKPLNWDDKTRNVIHMQNMFNDAYNFNQDISSWDVSSVTNMSEMFKSAHNFNNGGKPLNWGDKTKHVTNMEAMFAATINFNQDISSWDVSSVTNMSSMFHSALKFNNDGKALNWDEKTKNVTRMNEMFFIAYNFNQDISGWDVSNVVYMSDMFVNALEFNQDLSKWNVVKVEKWGNFATGSWLEKEPQKWPPKFRDEKD